jgi:hypothetical protein
VPARFLLLFHVVLFLEGIDQVRLGFLSGCLLGPLTPQALRDMFDLPATEQQAD